MFAAIFILAGLPFLNWQARRSFAFYPVSQVLFWSFFGNIVLLTWIGARPVEAPYEQLGGLFTGCYFLFFIINPLRTRIWDWLLES